MTKHDRGNNEEMTKKVMKKDRKIMESDGQWQSDKQVAENDRKVTGK